MSDETVREALRRRLAGRGAASAMARQLGVSACYLSQMKNGERPVSTTVAALLGFRKVMGWERHLGGPSDPA